MPFFGRYNLTKSGDTVYPKKYAHGFCFAVLCGGYRLTDFPIFIRLTLLALWQSNDCPSASKATLTNMDKYFMWIHCERLHNHNKAKHNKTLCIFLGIYCTTPKTVRIATSHRLLNLIYLHIPKAGSIEEYLLGSCGQNYTIEFCRPKYVVPGHAEI